MTAPVRLVSPSATIDLGRNLSPPRRPNRSRERHFGTGSAAADARGPRITSDSDLNHEARAPVTTEPSRPRPARSSG